MRNLIKKFSPKRGLPPGSVIHVGAKSSTPQSVSKILYSPDKFIENKNPVIAELSPADAAGMVQWISVNGLHETNTIEQIGSNFSVDPLILEDIAHTGQRIKHEIYGRKSFLVLNDLEYDPVYNILKSLQVSIVFDGSSLITFQENEDELFSGLKDSLKKETGRIRHNGSGYLVYAMLDTIVDDYFLIFESIGAKIEELEYDLVNQANQNTLNDVNRLRGNLIMLRKSIWPLRDILNGIIRGDMPGIEDDLIPYFKDVHDHTLHLIEIIESIREIIAGMFDLYLSSMSIKTNSAMKVLTGIATIFIPLTFIAGLYGMNFKYMPGINCVFGFYIIISIMIIITIGMIFYFKSKKWM